MGGYYKGATICLNGHVLESTEPNSVPHCKMCGESTISNCVSCNKSIRGKYEYTNVVNFSPYKKPYYCFNCGNPYPWTSRVIDNAIEIIYLDEELTEEHKEIIKNALPDLITEKPSTPVAIAKYKKYMSGAQSFAKEGLRNILVDVVSETVKKSIWG